MCRTWRRYHYHKARHPSLLLPVAHTSLIPSSLTAGGFPPSLDCDDVVGYSNGVERERERHRRIGRGETLTEAKTAGNRSTESEQGDGRWGRAWRGEETFDSSKLSSEAKRGKRAGSTSTGSAGSQLTRKGRRYQLVCQAGSLGRRRRTNVQVRPSWGRPRWYSPRNNATGILIGPTCCCSCRSCFCPDLRRSRSAYRTLVRSLYLHDLVESLLRG
mmetsp:Transcript_15013/g.46982  ORF Transcript_15013/g.46982 Transcript_15013/m.46982 type:complete len:216 (+) Transcript_15013:254-901(+)